VSEWWRLSRRIEPMKGGAYAKADPTLLNLVYIVTCPCNRAPAPEGQCDFHSFLLRHLVRKLLSHCCFAGSRCVLVSCRGTVPLFEAGAAASVAALDERRTGQESGPRANHVRARQSLSSPSPAAPAGGEMRVVSKLRVTRSRHTGHRGDDHYLKSLG